MPRPKGSSNKEWTTRELKLLGTLRDHGMRLREIALLMKRGIESIKHACIIHEIPATNTAYAAWLFQYEIDGSPQNATKHFGCSARKAKYWKNRLLKDGHKIQKQKRGPKDKRKSMVQS